MPFLKLHNRHLDVYYELHGDSANKPLVLINGLTRDHTAWKRIVPELAKNYYLLIFDNRGVGQTQDQGEPFTVDTMADDTIALIDALNFHKPYLAGHSLGGAVAQVIAKKYPQKIQKIALCNTFIQLNQQAREAFEYTLKVHLSGATQAVIVDTLIPWVFSKSFVTPEMRTMIHQLSEANPYPQSSVNYQRQLDALKHFDSVSWVNNITLPTLVIGSEEDVTATPEECEQLASCITAAKLELLPGAHGCYAEQPVLLVEKLQGFFTD